VTFRAEPRAEPNMKKHRIGDTDPGLPGRGASRG
jgi:hypothetical protein